MRTTTSYLLTLDKIEMKTLKTFLVVLAISFGFSIPVTTNFSETQFYSSGKGKLLTAQIIQPATFVVIAVEGSYEFYLRYSLFNLYYQKPVEEKGIKKEKISPSCTWLTWI